MKPTFKTTALAILISLGAVACGSSGGGSSSTEQKQPVVKQNPKLQKQESNKTTAVKTENKKANSEQDKLQAQIKQLQDRINELQQKSTPHLKLPTTANLLIMKNKFNV
ncbi:hypothetical protein HPC37_10600 [Pasteurellaceae bacterium 20609_3]|uniref:hypothetical protein n=1 Tax=Spirabiliibacterium mucosae TaxID=28156 RepID=UPI001AAD63F3|nr:hypothetical protein [Spirabiliibacterium mucosae]MBE2899197.1 hypothetical protein [Spirabiliibacterium mucosae]